jgi:hypothetical protein
MQLETLNDDSPKKAFIHTQDDKFLIILVLRKFFKTIHILIG